MNGGPAAQMPQYQCHKKVWALKIKSVINAPPDAPEGSMALEIEGNIFAPINVDAEYMERHKPKAGGYYVVYNGGYKSFSPAKEFEDGYTLING